MPSTQPLCEGSARWQEREWLHEQPEDWWNDVFDRIACGVSPRDIAKEYCLRYAILARVIGETSARKAEYIAALEIASDSYAHEVVGIADSLPRKLEDGTIIESDVARDKLRIETRLKLAGKWHRSRYGEAVKVEHAGTLKIDAGLVLAMGDLLERAATGRVLEHEAPQTLTYQVPESLAVPVAESEDIGL